MELLGLVAADATSLRRTVHCRLPPPTLHQQWIPGLFAVEFDQFLSALKITSQNILHFFCLSTLRSTSPVS
jgi:hypothetical protein